MDTKDGYLENPEIKKAYAVFLLIMSIFIVSNYMIIKNNNDRLKSDYVKVMANITARVVEKDPALEKEIVPLMTNKISKVNEAKGIAIIKQYGLSDKLDTKLFPYINDNFRRCELSAIFAGAILTFILVIFIYLQYSYFYKNIRAFNLAAKKIVDGDYNMKLSEEKEGDLSKLTKSFNSMGEVIRNHISALEKEKSFLVDLLSDISHQLKTPLSTLILYNDIMINKDLVKEQRDVFLKNNQSVLKRMSWLILSMLKLAKIDANAIELEIENQSLKETIEESIDALQAKAEESKVKVEFIYDDKSINFEHDRLWLQEALINIIKNAIEHSSKEAVVTIELEDNPVYTRIIISDSGEGICEEDLANIFKRFYKGKKSKGSQKEESIGIGLSLAKSIVERHGGFIEARSKRGEGTKFIITFLKY
jgi:signal transduction histidine kinase